MLKRALLAGAVAAAVIAAAACAGQDSAAAPQAERAAGSAPIEHVVQAPGGRIQAREWPGKGPAIVLMHGFPDDMRLYDRVVPELAGRRVITFDFLGWGRSDAPPGRTYTAETQTQDVNAVMEHFRLRRAVLVVHDSSGIPGIEWARTHADRVAGLVLLNTYYSLMPTLRPPEAILINSTPELEPVADAIAASPEANRAFYLWQVGGFFADDAARARYLPQFAATFPRSFPAFRSLNESLLADVTAATATVRTGGLAGFAPPVRIVFGADDPYLNTGVAEGFTQIFPEAELTLVQGARHYVQMDRPERVAEAILAIR